MKIAVAVTLACLAMISCGKVDPETNRDENTPTPVAGKASFGFQCPYGTVSNLVPVGLTLWDCPVGLKTLELVQPPQPLIFQADCKKKTISVRSQDRTIDTLWNVMPDGTFVVNLPSLSAQVFSDGSASNQCTSAISADLTGRLDCIDRDQIKIQLETVWWLAKGTPNPQPSAAASASCQFPASCYLYSSLTIPQCIQ